MLTFVLSGSEFSPRLRFRNLSFCRDYNVITRGNIVLINYSEVKPGSQLRVFSALNFDFLFSFWVVV